MSKRETPEEWEHREQELGKMGFNGGQGRSNHEIYESLAMFSWFIFTFAVLVAAAVILKIVLNIMGA